MIGFETIGGGGGCGHGGSHTGGWGWGGNDHGGASWSHGAFGGDASGFGAALSPSEYSAAQSALTNLAGGGASSFFSSDPSGQGGSHALLGDLHQLSNGLFSGLGTDTFAGGATGGHVSFSRFVSDSVHGGSAPAKAPTLEGGAAFHLGSDKVSVAGTTAAAVKSLDTNQAVGGSHTVSLPDKTTITLSGVSSNAIAKPTGH